MALNTRIQKKHISQKKLDLPRHETCSSRRLHANVEEKQEKTYVNENLENTPKHIMLTEKTHQR